MLSLDQLLCRAVSYSQEEDRFTALLAAALVHSAVFSEAVARHMEVGGSIKDISLQHRVSGARPDLGITADGGVTAVEVKLDHVLGPAQLEGMRGAVDKGELRQFWIVAPLRNLSRPRTEDEIGDVRDRVVTWGQIHRLAWESNIQEPSKIVGALMQAIAGRNMLDFGGLTNEDLFATRLVAKLLGQARLLGEAVCDLLQKQSKIRAVARSNGGLSWSKSRPSDTYFTWTISLEDVGASLFIGFSGYEDSLGLYACIYQQALGDEKCSPGESWLWDQNALRWHRWWNISDTFAGISGPSEQTRMLSDLIVSSLEELTETGTTCEAKKDPTTEGGI